jgi:S-formylglutathione hydrolase FrmB
MELKTSTKAFGGELRKYTHASEATGGTMTFSVYLPPAAALGPCPVIYYLSGLTCTDDNAAQKGGAFKVGRPPGTG